MENQNQMNQNNDYSNAEITVDKNFIIMFKFRQLIQYGVSIERIVFPKSYEYVNDFVKGLDKVEIGQDENIHVWMNVPSNSEYLDENNTPISGDYLAKKFKKDMEGIYTTSVNKRTLDENPDAYQSIDHILENLHVRSNPEYYNELLKSIEQLKKGNGKERELRDE